MKSPRHYKTVALAATAALAAVVPIAASASTADAATPPIKITFVRYDSPGSDRGGNASLNAEYVVIKNMTRTNRSLTGWTLRDAANHIYRFPAFTLRAGASVTVHTGKGTATQAHRYYNKTWYVWNNTGDTAYLRTATGALVHKVSWTGNGSGYRAF